MSCKAQTENQFKKILDTSIVKAKELSLYSENVDWNSLENKIYESSKNAKELADLKPSFEILLNGLRDHHGAIRTFPNYENFARFTDYENTRSKENREFDLEVGKIINNPDAKFEYELLENKIGYLKIVGVGQNIDGQKEADRIRNAVIELNKKNVDKWIIDLRYNGGGNVNVMLSGIAPLLDASKILTIQDYKDNEIAQATIENGNFTYYGSQPFQMSDEPKINNPKIAVLISRWTVSSGEFVAVAFKGQKKTKFFGEETGGYTTNTSWEIIGEKIILSISTGIYCDRNGIKYPDNVKPDIQMEFKVENDLKKDKEIEIATEWLTGK